MTKLAIDERMVWTGRPAWSTFLGSFLLGAILFVVGVISPEDPVKFGNAFRIILIAGALAVWGNLLLQRVSVRYEVTSQRAIVERGLLSRHVSEIELANVRDIQLRQSIEQRLLGAGTLEISSAGRDTAEVVFTAIANPDAVKELVRTGMREIPGKQ